MRELMPWALRSTVLSAVLLASSLSASAATTVLNFDDLLDGVVPMNYGGLNWSLGGWTAFSAPAAPYTANSGAGRITTGFGADDASSLIDFGQAVQFEGAYFAGLGGAGLSFQLFSGGTLVHQSALLDPSETPTFLASGYAGLVDAVRISSANHGEFVMDDLSFTTAVPEPQTYALLLSGLAVVGWVARRRRPASN